MRHASGQPLILVFVRTGATVRIGSTVAISAGDEYDYFALIDGEADIQLGGNGGSGTFVAVQFLDEDNQRRFTVTVLPASSSSSVSTLGLTVNQPPAGQSADMTKLTMYLPNPDKTPMSVDLVDIINKVTMNIGQVVNPQGSVVLAEHSYLVPGNENTPPAYYRQSGESGAVIVATLSVAAEGSVGGVPVGDTRWSASSGGQLNLVRGNVLEIPASETPTKEGATLTVEAVLMDGLDNDGNPVATLANLAERTSNYTVAFTVSYKTVEDLAANVNVAAKTVYGLTGEGRDRVVANVNAEGGAARF